MVLLNSGGDAASASRRAAESEDAVLGRFVGRFLGLPGTRLARTIADIRMPLQRVRRGRVRVDRTTPFHYWWQAHLLDAIVDAGHRKLGGGDEVGARRSALLGRQLLGTIIVRNGITVLNHFYDDMAWLALSAHRLDQLHHLLGDSAGTWTRRRSLRSLTRELEDGQHDGGALFWNKDRDFLNAAATGPAALHLVRCGRITEGRGGVEWSLERLLDDRGLVMDGLRVDGTLETRVYTYNQGPTIAALLELGGQRDIARASALIRAVGTHLRAREGSALITHGTGDGGLFTGILVRYLALASRDVRLPMETRGIADDLVRGTATALWCSRGASTVFPATLPPRRVPPPQRVELSTQLQGWMVMEAAASIAAAGRAET